MEDKERTAELNKPRKVHPKKRANFLSQTFFCWTIPFFIKGYKKDLVEDDLYTPLKAHESKRLGDKLEKAWHDEENFHRNPSLWRAIWKVFGKEIMLHGFIYFVIEMGFELIQPLLLGNLLSYFVPNQTTMTKKEAFLQASLIVGCLFASTIIIHNFFIARQHLGMKLRVACCSLIYRKSLRLTQGALSEVTAGKVINLMSNDVRRVDAANLHIHDLWIGPIQAIALLYLMYSSVGPYSYTGVIVFLLLIPVQLYIGKRTAFYRLRASLKTDQRVRLMSEIISGIQVIKMYTWEKPFAKLVEKARKTEMAQIKATSYLAATDYSFMFYGNRLALFICITSMVLTGHPLEARKVYMIISFYVLLSQAMVDFFSMSVTAIAECKVSIGRIQEFLRSAEVQLENHPKKVETKRKEDKPVDGNSIGIYMQDVATKWASSAQDYTLDAINFNAGPRQLVAVIGTVGSGKSTLLETILGELSPVKGNLDVEGSISYAAQKAWLFSGSVRQNILFGRDMDTKKYQEVVKVCALERDFSLFPYGDRTIVGERGILLSGGQKARISLARAIYKDANIYLLDDPLSAVDAQVGRQIFDECIAGYLMDKCVVLVTHQLQYIKMADQIYLMENGKIAASGAYIDLQDSQEDFLKLLKLEPEEDKKENPVDKDVESKTLEQTNLPAEEKEQKSVGTVSREVYKSYFRAGGSWLLFVFVFASLVLTQLGGSCIEYFVAFWVNMEERRTEYDLVNQTETGVNGTEIGAEWWRNLLTTYNCIYVYAILLVFTIIMSMASNYGAANFCIRASRNLHNNMFSRVVYTTMRFFNTNSSGRVLNRFSKDVGTIDEVLPHTLIDSIWVALVALSVIVIVSTINPWILVPTAVIFVLFYFFRLVFLATSRDLKRLEGTTRSPVFAHLTASLQGLPTIRAFGAQNDLIKEFDGHQNLHSSASYMFLACNRTLGFWLDFCCTSYTALITMSFLVMGNETLGGQVGLAITQALNLIGMLQWGIRQWSELENQMTSVERVIEYTELPPEPDDVTKQPPTQWPSSGNIEFQSVSMQYSNDDPLVLKSLSFRIKAGEKIGIVGRTGAGKSSLISVLFRLVSFEGKVLIDGVDTKEISLNSLRSKISIIPQEPVLFSGTVRDNLDPFGEHADSQLWDALEQVELKNKISELEAGLQSAISDGGFNFSVGQRQLLCLARAIIRSNTILVLDEATANVDPRTDELIQRTLRKKFASCTVLTIAHRLNTVMDSSKVLVMDAGCAVEFGHPYSLLKNKRGALYALVNQTGRGMAETLMRVAEENYL